MSVEAIGLLSEPVRRAVYEYAARQPQPVGRDEVAAAVGIGRTLAAFHLDKLAAGGLLEVSFGRRVGGPGAGRPPKLYRRTATELAVSMPPRGYRALAEILAEAVETVGADVAAQEAARRYGAAASASSAAGAASVGSAADPETLLAGLGYEPYRDGPDIRLRNCPFGAVAEAFPPLVCGLNLGLIEGVLAGAGCAATARMDPHPTGCCVAVATATDTEHHAPIHRP